MSTAAKALILTWVLIGLLVAGGVGFYWGRITTPKNQGQYPAQIQPRGGIGDEQPVGGQKPPPSGLEKQPQGPNRE